MKRVWCFAVVLGCSGQIVVPSGCECTGPDETCVVDSGSRECLVLPEACKDSACFEFGAEAGLFEGPGGVSEDCAAAICEDADHEQVFSRCYPDDVVDGNLIDCTYPRDAFSAP